VIKLIQIDKSQITLLNQMYLFSVFTYFYNPFMIISFYLFQSDHIKHFLMTTLQIFFGLGCCSALRVQEWIGPLRLRRPGNEYN
jgi:hypothetical protein